MMRAIVSSLMQSRGLVALAGLSLLGTTTGLVVLALGHSVAAIVVLLITTQLLVLGLGRLVSVNYRRQEKRARTWGVRHSVGQHRVAQAVQEQRKVRVTRGVHDGHTGQLSQLSDLQDKVEAVLEEVRELSTEVAARDTVRTAQLRRTHFEEVFRDRL